MSPSLLGQSHQDGGQLLGRAVLNCCYWHLPWVNYPGEAMGVVQGKTLEMPQKIWESEGSSKQLLHSVSAGGALLVVVEFWKILKAALHQNVIYASLFSQEKRFCSLVCCHSGQVCNIKFSVCYEASEASDKVVALWSFSKHKATT